MIKELNLNGRACQVLKLVAPFLLVLIVAACDRTNVVPAVTPQNTPTSESYPAPATLSGQTVQEAYPAATPTRTGTLLALDKPIQPGDTMVSGVGPPGLPILVLNVTLMGEELGAGTIGDDGTFSITVDPLPAGTRVGLTADLQTAGLTEEAVRPGEGEINVPQVGYFYDSTVIPQN